MEISIYIPALYMFVMKHMASYMEISMYPAMRHMARYMEISIHLAMKHMASYLECYMLLLSLLWTPLRG